MPWQWLADANGWKAKTWVEPKGKGKGPADDAKGKGKGKGKAEAQVEAKGKGKGKSPGGSPKGKGKGWPGDWPCPEPLCKELNEGLTFFNRLHRKECLNCGLPWCGAGRNAMVAVVAEEAACSKAAARKKLKEQLAVNGPTPQGAAAGAAAAPAEEPSAEEEAEKKRLAAEKESAKESAKSLAKYGLELKQLPEDKAIP